MYLDHFCFHCYAHLPYTRKAFNELMDFTSKIYWHLISLKDLDYLHTLNFLCFICPAQLLMHFGLFMSIIIISRWFGSQAIITIIPSLSSFSFHSLPSFHFWSFQVLALSIEVPISFSPNQGKLHSQNQFEN